MKRADRILRLISVVALLALCAYFTATVYVRHLPWATMFDFQSFYCAGQAVLAHQNPYFTQPLHNCEAQANPGFFAVMGNVTIPAPLPPYALVLLAPFSLLPWHVACDLWVALLVAAIALSGYWTSRLTNVPLGVCLSAMFCAMAFPSLIPAALAPVPIALWLAGALLLRSRRWTIAAIVLGVAMIEPHIGLPICIAVFLGLPALRLRLLGVGALLVLLQCLATPLALTRDYFALLQLHAPAEVSNAAQHSLTFLLHNLGISAPVALHVGFAQYVIFCILGIVLGLRMQRQDGDPAWLVLTPAALSVVGGPFVHLTEIAITLPYCLLLAQKRDVNLAKLAALFLAIPWFAINEQPWFIPFGVLAVCGLVYHFWRPNVFVLGVVGTALAAAVMYIDPHGNMPFEVARSIVYGVQQIHQVPPTTYASVTWGEYNDLFTPSMYWIVGHLPTWLGLLLLSGVTLSVSFEAESDALLVQSQAG